MTPELLKLALVHAIQQAPAESTALLVEVDGAPTYWPCENVEGLGVAYPAAADLCGAEDAGRVLGFVHSHSSGSVVPSPADVAGCEDFELPWWIVEPGGAWSRTDPRSRELLRRQFCFGVDDCWSLLRDWYAREMGLSLPDFVREPGFWETGFEPHRVHCEEAGFAEVSFGSIQKGDAMMFRVKAKTITHSGVYLGDGNFLHHVEHQLSRIEQVTPSWVKRLAFVARPK